MARLISCSATTIDELADGWECTSTRAGEAGRPADIDRCRQWYPASVPGTFAGALRDTGAWNGEAPLDLDSLDVWYRTSFVGGDEETLHFAGLATIADVWLNDEHILRSSNMFLPAQVAVRTRSANDLYIRFSSLTHWLQGQKGRARWRTRVATPATLRFARTTLLGRMPGWCPAVQPVGPWRPVSRRRQSNKFDVTRVDAHTSVQEGTGYLSLRCSLDGLPPDGIEAIVRVGEAEHRLQHVSPQEFAGEMVIPHPELWWPHTHGDPNLHKADLYIGNVHCDLGDIGFRHVTADYGDDGNGFGLRVNGEAIFCRGACWTTPDIVTLPGTAVSYRPWLEAMRDAGLNTVRIGGTMATEADAFYSLCDELGLLVWQDAMLANFDYPATTEFRASLVAELEHFLHRTELNPSLAVFCGGSEVLQQAAMFGLTREQIDDDLYRTAIPEAVQRMRPELIYVANSPSGGDLPFLPNQGVAHYYGVGAYLRPLSDARLANVRFASECLAIANVPCSQTADAMGVATTTDPRWKRAVPRDPGAGWDFDDVRDHYLATFFRVDPLHLRYANFERYLQLSRAVSCILVEEVLGEWRRAGSNCRGGLIWQWQDLMPGAGWGVVDSLGRRKPVWYALLRASRPQTLILTDEGLNGLDVHVINEAPSPLRAILKLACLKDGRTPVREAEQPIVVAPRSAMRLGSAALLPGFFDITYAYRFGPPAHDATIASLHNEANGELIADAFHFPDLTALRPQDVGLEVVVERDRDDWYLRLLSHRLTHFLHIEDAAFMACENWLHLAPGHERRIALLSTTDPTAVPTGEIRALNMDRTVRYAGRR